MHNVVRKVLLIIVAVLIALFAYKIIKTPNLTSPTVSVDNKNQKASDAQSEVEKVELIIKEFLLNNPEVIIQAIEGLQQRKMQEMESKISQVVHENKNEIESANNAPVIGNPNGDIIIAAFYDYNCGYCKKGDAFVEQLIKLDNKVKLVLKPFPIMGDSSKFASLVALAVYQSAPDKFQSIHHGLMEMRPVTKEAVEKLLSDNMLDSKLIEKVMQSEAIQKSLDKNIKLAKELKMQGVPAYIINGKLIPGMIDLDQLKAIVTEIRAAK
jgi:protein-disulfide isomerase